MLSFFGGGMYQISITNSFGTLVYADILPADGMEYSYDLSGIGEGMFRLVLEGPGGEYEGYFNVSVMDVLVLAFFCKTIIQTIKNHSL